MKMRLLLLVFSCVVCGAEKLHNLKYYELVNVVEDTAHETKEDGERIRDTESYPYKRRLTFDGHGRRFDVHLKRSDVIPKKVNVITQNHDDVGNSYHFQDHPVQNCYYHGRLGVEEDAPVVGSGSMCDEEGFRGTLTHEDGEQFTLRPLEKDDLADVETWTPGTYVLYNSKDVLIKKDMPKNDVHKTINHGANEFNVQYDSNKIYGRDDERTIEVIPVVTYEMYILMGRDIGRVVKQVIAWVHEADGEFQELDKKTHMVMVGLVVWDKGNEADQGVWSMPGYAGKIMRDKLGLHFDTVILIFNGGGWWGLSPGVGHVCNKNTAVICSATSFKIGHLMYHEVLHGLGLTEPELGKGAKGKVVKKNFNKYIDQNAFPCLYKRAAKEFKKNTCGNGVKEAGEVCDCVSEYECKKRGEFECCDPKTCQLRANMQCMDGGCCEKCMFKKSGDVCIATDKCLSRSSSTCSGTSEKCVAASQSLPAQKIGCYRLKYNARKHNLFNGGQRYNNDYDENMKGILCQCARSAREAEREYFAMNGENCYAVSKDDLLSNYDTGKSQVQKSNAPVVKNQACTPKDPTKDCWYKCGSKGGSCPGFCGDTGYCCKKGEGDCPAMMGNAAHDRHHSCVRCASGTPAVVQLRLINAEQSTTHTSSGCSGVRTCAAEKAIDGNMKTTTATYHVSDLTWWMAQLSNRSKIEDIRITTNRWAFNEGFFNKLKIKTAENINGPWSVCRSQFKMTLPYVDHKIKCVNPTVANYIKIEVYGKVPLYLNEVKVRGYNFAGKLPKIPKKPCNGIDNNCCTEISPCAEADGDCDTDAQCEGNLVCGTNNCPKRSPFHSSDDCCMKGHCNLVSKVNKDKLICNKPNYKSNNPNACTSGFNDIYFVYKVDVPNINRCPTKKSNEIGAKLPTKKGCYLLKGTSSPSRLVDNSGYYIPKHKPSTWSVTIRKLLCECAEIAKKRGGKFVGLQDNKCSMIDETDLGIESNDKCYLADGYWTSDEWYRYKCSKNNLHNNSPHPCVGAEHDSGGNTYFVYQL